MSWALREYSFETDCAPVARLYTWADEFTWTAKDIEGQFRRWPEEKPMLRLVAEVEGEVVGYGRTCLMSPNPMGSFLTEAIVDPRFHRRGIGGALLSRLEQSALDFGARTITGLVRKGRPETIAALEHMGYEVKTLFYECVRDPRTFDVAPFGPLFAALAEAGYQVKALAELPTTEETDRALFDAMDSSDRDAPFMDYFGFYDFESYRQMVMDAQWYDRNGVFVAMKEGEIVGLSSINRGSVEFNGEMFIEFTGVLSGHRGRGLATAMKARALEFAKSIGGTIVRTENNTENQAMLRVNRRLGFEDKPGQWMVVKALRRLADVV